jgi:hypothetical protein
MALEAGTYHELGSEYLDICTPGPMYHHWVPKIALRSGTPGRCGSQFPAQALLRHPKMTLG